MEQVRTCVIGRYSAGTTQKGEGTRKSVEEHGTIENRERVTIQNTVAVRERVDRIS